MKENFGFIKEEADELERASVMLGGDGILLDDDLVDKIGDNQKSTDFLQQVHSFKHQNKPIKFKFKVGSTSKYMQALIRSLSKNK